MGGEIRNIFISGTVHYYLAFSIGLPYPTFVFRVFPKKKIGDVIVLTVVVPLIENVLGILTLKQG